MRYVSTRGRAPALGFCDALLAGLAADGGLYVPERWPVLPPVSPGEPYARVAAGAVAAFAGDELEPALLERLCAEAYAGFRHPAICPLAQLDADEWLLELFHGPTLAFKDLALQLVGRLFDHVLSERDERITVLVATSGDTGSAAISGLASCSRADIVVLYPEGRVSDVQRRQMTTVADANVHAVAVDGTFDDCQAIVKQLFGERDFRERVGLAAANSINWARVAAQVAYYVWATSALGGRALAFAVPTGNFGNVLSGWVARACGLPVERLVIGSNANDILPRLLATGRHGGARRRPHAEPEHGHPGLVQPRAPALRALRTRPGAHRSASSTAFARTGDARRSTRRALAALRELFEATALDDDATLAAMRSRARPQRHAARSPHGGRARRRPCARRSARETPLVALRDRAPGQVPGRRQRATGVRPRCRRRSPICTSARSAASACRRTHAPSSGSSRASSRAGSRVTRAARPAPAPAPPRRPRRSAPAAAAAAARASRRSTPKTTPTAQ